MLQRHNHTMLIKKETAVEMSSTAVGIDWMCRPAKSANSVGGPAQFRLLQSTDRQRATVCNQHCVTAGCHSSRKARLWKSIGCFRQVGLSKNYLFVGARILWTMHCSE